MIWHIDEKLYKYMIWHTDEKLYKYMIWHTDEKLYKYMIWHIDEKLFKRTGASLQMPRTGASLQMPLSWSYSLKFLIITYNLSVSLARGPLWGGLFCSEVTKMDIHTRNSTFGNSIA